MVVGNACHNWRMVSREPALQSDKYFDRSHCVNSVLCKCCVWDNEQYDFFPLPRVSMEKDTWLSQKTPDREIKKVFFIYYIDSVLCAAFITSLFLVSQRRTNSWVPTRYFHRGLFFPPQENTGLFVQERTRQCFHISHFLSMLSEKDQFSLGKNFLVYLSPSSFTGLPSAGAWSSEARHYHCPGKLPVACLGISSIERPQS